MATAPTLYWYQLDVGTLSATYFGQLNTTVTDLCAENSVTAPTAPWQNSIGGTLFSKWQTQIDTAVRALCAILVVTEPIPLVRGSNAGQFQTEYAESLDACVRALCVPVAPYVGPLDLVPGAVVAYSPARALSAAWLGQPLYTLRRDSDNTTQSFSADAVTGEAPVAIINTFIGAAIAFVGDVTDTSQDISNIADTTGLVVGQFIHGTGIPSGATIVFVGGDGLQISVAATDTNIGVSLTADQKAGCSLLRDQSGNGIDCVQATADNQIIWVPSAQGGKPGFRALNGTQEVEAEDGVSIAGGAFTIFFVSGTTSAFIMQTDPFNQYAQMTLSGGSPHCALDAYDDGTENEAGGSYNVIAGLAIWEATWEFGSKTLLRNGVAQSVASDFDSGGPLPTLSDLLVEIYADQATCTLEGFAYEGIMSAPNRALIRQNIATYYGITI